MIDQAPADGRCGATVESDGAEILKVMEQLLDPIVLGEANRLVQTPPTRC